MTYLWVPTEYFRNLIHAPAALQAGVAVLTVAVVAGAFGLALRSRAGAERQPTDPAAAGPKGRASDDPDDPTASDTEATRSAWLLLGWLGVYSLVGYLVLEITVVDFPPRTAFVALPLWSSAVGYLVGRLVEHRSAAAHRGAVAAAVALVLALDLWVLAAVRTIGPISHSFL